MLYPRQTFVLFSKPGSLSQQICRTNLQELHKEAIQSKPHQGNRCQLCTAFVSASCVTSTISDGTSQCRNQGATLQYEVGCACDNVCGMQYVVQTNNARFFA